MNPRPTKEVIRFKVGGVYRLSGRKSVCVHRHTDGGGIHVGFVDLAEHRANLKDEFFGGYEEEGADYEMMLVRVRRGIEFATDAETIKEAENPGTDANGVYDFDSVIGLRDSDFDFRADREFGESKMKKGAVARRKERKVVTVQKTSKRLKCWIVAAWLLMVVGVFVTVPLGFVVNFEGTMPAAPYIGGVPLLGGIVLYIATKFRVAWNHS